MDTKNSHTVLYRRRAWWAFFGGETVEVVSSITDHRFLIQRRAVQLRACCLPSFTPPHSITAFNAVYVRYCCSQMEEIQELVRKVVQQCASRGVSVSEVLAAFVARTVSGTHWRVEKLQLCSRVGEYMTPYNSTRNSVDVVHTGVTPPLTMPSFPNETHTYR